jgi:hypothetical protein
VGTGVTMGIVAGLSIRGYEHWSWANHQWGRVGTLTLDMTTGASVDVRGEGLSPSKQGCSVVRPEGSMFAGRGVVWLAADFHAQASPGHEGGIRVITRLVYYVMR